MVRKTEVHKLPCGHVIEEYKRWCPSCNHQVAKIEYGYAGICPYCNKPYRTDKYKFYIGEKK